MSPAAPLSLIAAESRSNDYASIRTEPEHQIAQPDHSASTIDINILEEYRLLERRSGKSVLPEMFSILESQVSESWLALRQAFAETDTVTVRRISHKLKSSTHCLGMVRLSALCAELERRVSTGTSIGTGTLLSALEDEYVHASMALHRYLAAS